MSETLIGKYRLLAELGRGGMSDVYLAASNGLGGFQKLVVLKVSRVSDDPAFAQMFLDEARLSARLSHSNIVQTYEVGEENGRQFIVMEYLDGPSLYVLNRLSANTGGVPLRMVVQILSGVLTGLQYAHTLKDFDGTLLNVVHRDVSPQNIMVTSEGEVKILDFGIAKTSDSRTMTHAGFYRGKLNYMSPEQALGQPVDARADIFSVGVLLAEAITRKPFWGDATTAVISARLINGDIPDIEQAGIEPLLEEICKGALIADRTQRMNSAREFKDALDLYLGTVGGPVSSEELAAFVAPLVAADKQRVAALIDQQLNQAGPPIPVNIALPRSSTSSHATLRTPAPLRSRGSGYTPISSTSSIRPRPETPSAQPQPSMPPSHASVTAAPPPAPMPPFGDEGPTLSGGPPLPRPTADRGVRTALRKPDAPPAPLGGSDSNGKVIIGLVAGGFVVLVGLVVWLATRQPAVIQQVPVPAVTDATAGRDTPPPAKTKVEISVEPLSATLELDGAAVANPYVAMTPQDGKPHRVMAKAPGFEPQVRDVTFDRDLTMSLTLKAVAAPTPPRPVVEAPTPTPQPVATKAPPPPPPVVVRRPPPPKTTGKQPAVAGKEDGEVDQPIQELAPKPKTTPNGKRGIDTEVFDDKKQEIDRSAPWEN